MSDLALIIAETIRRGEAGEAFVHRVDREGGYRHRRAPLAAARDRQTVISPTLETAHEVSG